jgi:anti-sigma-K factor RskA
MSDVQDHSGLPEDELIAAEYALGVLAGTERDAAERRIERDLAFANLVEAWEQRLAPLAEEIALRPRYLSNVRKAPAFGRTSSSGAGSRLQPAPWPRPALAG